VLTDGADCGNIELPESLELRLRSSAPTPSTDKAQKRHGGKKKSSSFEQGCSQKEFDRGQKIQSSHATDKCVM